MNTTFDMNLETAIAQIVDALLQKETVILGLARVEGASNEIEDVFVALHAEAQRRGLGITIAEQEGDRWCLSLLHP